MKCPSCQRDFWTDNSGNCRKCYEEASKTMELLKPQINDLEAKVDFLSLPLGLHFPSFSDVVLVASDGGFGHPEANPVPVHAHRAVLVFERNWKDLGWGKIKKEISVTVKGSNTARTLFGS